MGKVARVGGVTWALFGLMIAIASLNPTEEPAIVASTEVEQVVVKESEPKIEVVAVVDAEAEKRDADKAKLDEENKAKAEKEKLEAAALVAAEAKKVEEAKSSKDNQTKVLAFEKSVYALEGTMSPIMDAYQEAMDGLGNGSVDVYTAYEATENARKAAKHLQTEFFGLEVPDSLPKDVKKLLNGATSDLSTAYYSKVEAFDYVLKFFDDQKPSYMSKFKEEISMSDSFIMSGIMKIIEAKTAVGLDMTEK